MVKNSKNKRILSRIFFCATFPLLMASIVFLPTLEAPAIEIPVTPEATPVVRISKPKLEPIPTPEPEIVSNTIETPWLCEGFMGSTIPHDNEYYITSFGCYVDSKGVSHGDSGDNCVPGGLQYARDAGVCAPWMSGRQCEEHVTYYTAGASRYAYLTKLQITNPENGKSVVAIVLDGGPACWVENSAEKAVIDVSRPVSFYLFGSGRGYTDKDVVIAEIVDYSTPLGPVNTESPPVVVAAIPETSVAAPKEEVPGIVLDPQLQSEFENAQELANSGRYDFAYNSDLSGTVDFNDSVPFVMQSSVKYAVNGRSGPNAQNALAGTLYRENGWETVNITQIIDGWGKVDTGGTGNLWVWMQYFERPPNIQYSEYVQSIGG